MRTFTFRILGDRGLDARRAAEICQVSERYQSRIQIGHQDVILSGKSLMGLIALQAGEGDELRVLIEGEDEEAAEAGMKEAFATLLGGRCVEDT